MQFLALKPTCLEEGYTISLTYTYLFIYLFILVRKIVTELTSVPIFFHFVCGTLPQHGLMSNVQVCAQDLKPRNLDHQSLTSNLTTMPLDWHLNLYFRAVQLHSSKIKNVKEALCGSEIVYSVEYVSLSGCNENEDLGSGKESSHVRCRIQ